MLHIWHISISRKNDNIRWWNHYIFVELTFWWPDAEFHVVNMSDSIGVKLVEAESQAHDIIWLLEPKQRLEVTILPCRRRRFVERDEAVLQEMNN